MINLLSWVLVGIMAYVAVGGFWFGLRTHTDMDGKYSSYDLWVHCVFWPLGVLDIVGTIIVGVVWVLPWRFGMFIRNILLGWRYH